MGASGFEIRGARNREACEVGARSMEVRELNHLPEELHAHILSHLPVAALVGTTASHKRWSRLLAFAARLRCERLGRVSVGSWLRSLWSVEALHAAVGPSPHSASWKETWVDMCLCQELLQGVRV